MTRWFNEPTSPDQQTYWNGWGVAPKASSIKTYVSAGVFALSAVLVMMHHGI